MFPISMVNFHIRSFHRNFTNFEAMLVAMGKIPFIFISTETWNTYNNVDHCRIKNYSDIPAFMDSMRGGVLLFCGVKFSMEKITDLYYCN